MVQAIWLLGSGGQIAHAALHLCRARQRVDLENAVELGQRQRHATLVRHGTARQPSARPARHHRHAQAVAGFQHLLNLFVTLGQGHHQGPLAVGGQPVAFVRRGLLVAPQQHLRRQKGLQRLNHLRLKLCFL